MTADNNLEPISPDEARELYIADRTDIADSTRDTHDKRLKRFVRWCEAQDIENLNTLSGRDCRRYKIQSFAEKEDGGEYSPETIRGYIDTLRVYLQFAASIDAVPPELPEKVTSPRPQNSRDEKLAAERAKTILQNLQKYEYATIEHVLVMLLWRTGIRIGTAKSLDTYDIDRNLKQITISHQPHEDTPLKNQWGAERNIAVSDGTLDIIDDYIDRNRHDVTDDEGRHPLLTSKQGRRSISSLREIIYAVTRPCEFGDNCPHNRDPTDCDAAQRKEWASKCPSTVSPHPARRGAITHMLRSGTPKPVVADRCDVSSDVLDAHYNQLDDAERAERRRDYLDDAFDDY